MADRADTCADHAGADTEDLAVSTFENENGMDVSLFSAIFGPASLDQETLELLGSSGRLVLTQPMGQIMLIRDYGRSSCIIDARRSIPGEQIRGLQARQPRCSHLLASSDLARELVSQRRDNGTATMLVLHEQ